MTGAGYRWTASFGLFLGVVTSLLTSILIQLPEALDEELSLRVGFVLSNLGVGVSMLSKLIHCDRPGRASLLDHEVVGALAFILNFYPWVLFAWLCWFFQLPPLE